MGLMLTQSPAKAGVEDGTERGNNCMTRTLHTEIFCFSLRHMHGVMIIWHNSIVIHNIWCNPGEYKV